MKNLAALLVIFTFAAPVLNAQGSVYINTKLGIGNSTPFWPLDILSNQAVGRFESSVSPNGSVIELKNTAVGSTYLGALNFSDSQYTPGQIAYSTDHNLSFRVNFWERVKINSSGLIANERIGIGQPNPYWPLDILSSQAVARLETNASTFGSVIELKNTADESTFLGALNFVDATSYPGQVAYSTDHNLSFRVNYLERAKINSSGLIANERIGIGNSTPFWPLDILSNQAVARLESTVSPNGSVIELKNTAVGSTYLGAINFSTAAGNPGQIAYLTDNNLSFRVSNVERAKINSSGLIVNEHLGIGQPNPFYPLEILSNQAVARLESTVSPNGSVIDLKNIADGSTYLGSLNFSSEAGTHGQVTYLTNNSLFIRVNNSERMRFTSEGRLGIGLSNPECPVQINQPAGVTLTDFQPVLKVAYTGPNSNDAIAVEARSYPVAGKGIGGQFTGGNTGGIFYGGHTGIYSKGYGLNSAVSYGINAEVIQNDATNTTLIGTKGYATGTNSTNYGTRGESNGANSTNYGVHGFANGTGSTNYGVFGTATNGNQNWAGYFNEGNVYVNNNLGIGQINPTVDLDILSTQAVARMITSNNINGAVITLQNTTVSPTYFGAINFGDGVTTSGQIGYLGDNNLAIRVNNAERFRINSSGFVGIGRTPVTNKLEVEGTASKSSSGDWLANSDARLKKNISPLDPEQMIEKLLTMKGVTYEWNDDKTGTERPEGIQYGFTAQNISEAFPSLVEEDAKGYLQTAYGTYDAMMVEALRYLYMENKELKNELEEIRGLIREMAEAEK